jgi:hypothetical protein
MTKHMRQARRLAATALAVVLGVLAGWIAMDSAEAATTPVAVESTCLEGWYVNPDEGGADPSQGDRRPVQEEGGLSFTGNQLVHHAAPEGLTVDELEPGTFKADPEPSLASFFSVEVWGEGGYATLRWNTSTSKWDMVTGGQVYSHEDPAELVKMTDPDKSSMVRTFGVGYVNSPNDGTKTVVSSITFAGTTYDLTCEPEPSPSVTTPAATTPPATPPATDPAATPSGTVPPVAGGPSLPVTGVGLPQIVTAGILLLIAGAVAYLLSPVFKRRRRTTFEA